MKPISMQIFRNWLGVLVFALLIGSAYADTASIRKDVDRQTARISEQASELVDEDANLSAISNILTSEREKAARFETSVRNAYAEAKQRLEWLGEPVEGETDRIAQQRKALSENVAALRDTLDQVGRNLTEIDRLGSEVSRQRRESRLDRLLKREVSPLDPTRLPIAMRDGQNALQTFYSSIADWINARRSPDVALQTGLVFFGALIFALFMTIPVRRWLNQSLMRKLHDYEPTTRRKVLYVVLLILLRVLPALIGGFAMYQALDILQAIPAVADPLARSVWLGFVLVVFVDGASRAMFSPNDPEWRILAVGTHNATLLRASFSLAALVLATDAVLRNWGSLFGATVNLQFILNAVTTLLLATFLLIILRRRFWRRPVTDGAAAGYAVEQSWLKYLRLFLVAIAFLAILATLLGYTTLSHAVLTRIYFISGMVALVFAIRSVMRELIHLVLSRSKQRRAEREKRELMELWLDLALDLVVFIAAVPLFLLMLGLDGFDLIRIGHQFADGFKIGNQQFSLAQVLIGIVAFVILMTFTRFFQRVIDKRVLSRMRVDDGVRNSLKTLIGYVGMIIALTTGIGMIGFDLSNLAIIAGALSVGIGFGLQSIVNNFVSGLILLFERPIKVGDWVVTSSGEGIVKKISVRSTEIETFDRSSILVPNSELISSSVTNWTHKNRLGRVTVPVGVAYKEDPERVIEILRAIPPTVEGILADPAPVIVFSGFGDSSLDFEVRAFIGEVTQGLIIRTNLRIAIFKAFRAENIEIPFPQRDLNFRSGTEGLAGLVNPEDKID